MCGIFGIINYRSHEPVAAPLLKEALSGMVHRGPDDEGMFLDGYAGLGMRRLSIIDRAGGHQPVFNETGGLALVFNGEIYNYRELREELTGKGHVFKTSSDTEVIVHLYEEYGERAPLRLNGMFAFAVWNRTKKELFLARDPVGIKPLFYADYDGRLVFSSELRPIVSLPGFPRDADPEAITDYLSFYYVSAPKTMYRAARRLPQGSSLTLSDDAYSIKRYWHYTFEETKMSEGEAVEATVSTFRGSVARHLQSEVPLGVFLSSGIDSTAIAAMMSTLGHSLRTYTIGYENGGTYNELNEARLVAEKYGTRHSDCILHPLDLTRSIPDIIAHFAEPHGDWTQAALYHLAREAKKEVTVVLAGMGGDELFGGYPTLIAAQAARYYRLLPGPLRSLIRAGVGHLPVSHERLSFDFKARAFVASAELPPEQAHHGFKEIFSSAERMALTGRPDAGDPFNVFRQHLPDVRDERLLNRLLYLDLNVFLPACALHVTDMATMMNSVECRVPFLDREMIELSARIPVSLKLKGLTTKYILRKTFNSALPPEILKMPKKGLAMPTSFWLKGPLRDFVLDTIAAAETRRAMDMNYAFARKLYDDHCSGKSDNTRKLTCLLSLLFWHARA